MVLNFFSPDLIRRHMLLYFHSPTQPSTQVYLCLSIFIAVCSICICCCHCRFSRIPLPPLQSRVFYTLLLLLCCHSRCRDIVSNRGTVCYPFAGTWNMDIM